MSKLDKIVQIKSDKLTEKELAAFRYAWMLGKEDIENADEDDVIKAYKKDAIFYVGKTSTGSITLSNQNYYDNKLKIIEEIEKFLVKATSVIGTQISDSYVGTRIVNNKEEKITFNYKIHLSDKNYKKYQETVKDETLLNEQIENNRLNQAESLIKKWSCTVNTSDPESQELININRFYDFYTGMTPYVEVYFRTGFKKEKENGKTVADWTSINSIEHPFISNINIKDDGVKTVTIELFDKDFASFTEFKVRKNGSFFEGGEEKKGYYSLDGLIKESLRNDFSTNSTSYEDKNAANKKNKEEFTTYYTDEDNKQKILTLKYGENIESNSIYRNRIKTEGERSSIKSKFEAWQKQLKVKKEEYYYKKEENKAEIELDENYLKLIQNNNLLSSVNLKIRFGYADYNEPLTNAKLKNYFKNKKSGVNTTTRNARWWSTSKDFGEDWNVTLNAYAEGGKVVIGKRDLGTAANNNKTDGGGSLSVKNQMKSKEQTTQTSREIELTITGYNSTLTSSGIKYTITAVEAKESELMKIKYLQRFSEVVDYPEGVLYTLMRIFNEYNGKLVDKKVKLVLMKDMYDDNDLTNSLLVQKYDLKNLTEEERKKVTYTDTFNAIKNGETINADMLAKISLGFGSEAALTNYKQVHEEPPKTKSVAALIDEFCTACPPKKLEQITKKVYNENGEEVKIDTTEQTARPLKWFSVVDNVEDKIYIVLYYRRQLKPEVIRQYEWGPNLPGNTCVKQISIENKNEFALLTGVKTFNSAEETIQNRINLENIKKTDSDSSTVTESATNAEGTMDNNKEYDVIANNAVTGEAYDIALSSGVYEGTIDILGDPFFLFNGIMQPCTYPIKLNVLVPRNETEMKKKEEVKEEVKKEHEKFGTATFDKGNQRFHEMSGYYVIKDIEHNISASGFTTKLNILSYPNISKQVLVNNKKPTLLN